MPKKQREWLPYKDEDAGEEEGPLQPPSQPSERQPEQLPARIYRFGETFDPDDDPKGGDWCPVCGDKYSKRETRTDFRGKFTCDNGHVWLLNIRDPRKHIIEDPKDIPPD